MSLGSDYDSWRLDNGEPSHFTCEHCDEKKPIEELAENDEICNDCLESDKDIYYLKKEDSL